MPQFSIIVPIYNIGKYIEKCIDSILMQSFCNYELILVNDGSTDNSLEKIYKYKVDNRITIISKKNGGLSSARNEGIKHAKGEYIMFIDGDDFLADGNCLNDLAKILKDSKPDVIQYVMSQYFEKNNKVIDGKQLPNTNTNSKTKVLDELNKSSLISVSACDKIVKTSIIKKEKIFFEKKLLCEDIDWSLRLYNKINTIKLLNRRIYIYRQQREGSISSNKNKQLAESLYSIIKKWSEYKYNDKKIEKIYSEIISYWYLILRVNFRKKDYSPIIIRFFKENDKKILKNKQNNKVKKAYKLSRLIGYKNTIIVLKTYIYLKDKGIIKL